MLGIFRILQFFDISYIVRNFPNIIYTSTSDNKVNTPEIDYLYMDCNSLIYNAVHSLPQDTHNIDKYIFKHITESIDSYIDKIQPEYVFILMNEILPANYTKNS